MNEEPDRIKFVNTAKALIDKANIKEFTFTVFKQETQEDIYIVFGRFNESQRIGNPYTGKYNFNSAQDVKTALEDFAVYLDSIKEALT